MDSLLSEPPGKPKNTGVGSLSLLQGDLPDPGIEPGSPALQADSLLSYWGIELDFCDVEWFALETNQDHSVIFEIAAILSTAFWTLLLPMRDTPFFVMHSCPQL